MKKWLKKQTDLGFRRKAPWHFNLMILVIVCAAAYLGYNYEIPTFVFAIVGLSIGLLYRYVTKGKYSDQINGESEKSKE